MTPSEWMAWASTKGVAFRRREDGRLIVVGIRRLSKAKQTALLEALAQLPLAADAPPSDQTRSAVTPTSGADQKLEPSAESTPVLYVDEHRVTEADVLEMLANRGDQEVEAYRAGRISKTQAYRRTANWLRQRNRLMYEPVSRSRYRYDSS